MHAGPFRRVLVGWDCSAGAAAALHAAVAIAADGTARVVALAVIRPAPHTEDRDEGAADLAGRRQDAERSFAKARDAFDDASRARVSLKFAESTDAARTLCEYAELHGYDLIVLGRHGLGGVLHPRLGHVAETAAKKSTIPLLLLTGR